MIARDALRWLGSLIMLEGLTLVLGGRQTLRIAGKLGPRWYSAWLGPLTELPAPVLRALGGVEFLLGLHVRAMAPPAPRIVEEIASLTLQPAETLWRDAFAACSTWAAVTATISPICDAWTCHSHRTSG